MKPLRPAEVPLEGMLLVEASAGTGKTFTITTLFVRLVVERGLSVREIVVVTFTEAATAEIRTRIRRRLREALAAFEDPEHAGDDVLRELVRRTTDAGVAKERLARAIAEIDLTVISTIHSFCLRVLQENVLESGARFELELAADTSELVRKIAEDFWSLHMVPMAPDLFRMVQKEVTLDVTRAVVATFSRRPLDLPVLPEATPADPEAHRAALATAFANARRIWRAQGEAVRELLLNAADDLKTGKEHDHRREHIERWCDELDRLFASDAPRFVTSTALAKLGTTELAKGTKARRTPPRHPFFDAAQKLFDIGERARRDLVLRLKLEAVDYVRREMARRKSARNVQGFEDLLFSLDRALLSEGGDALASALRGQFRAALVDEFQDTDPVQFRIFRCIFHGHAPLFFVGDPKQSIYAFRGADVFSCFTAAREARVGFTLDTNYRSDPSLVRAVNTIFEHAEAPFVFDDIAFQPVRAHARTDRMKLGASGAGPSDALGHSTRGTGALEILWLQSNGEALRKGMLDKAVPAIVANEISRFLASGARIDGKEVAAGDIAVLTRTNAQARAVQHALRRLGIPSVLEIEASVFESEEAAELETVLRAILEPTRAELVKTALATSIVGLDAGGIVALESDEERWQAWSDRLRAINDVWAKAGFVPAYRRLFDDLGVEPRLLSYVDGERRVTNLVHLGELLHAASVRERLGLTGLVRWLAAMRASPADAASLGSEVAELRLESDARAVKLLTIHKSKGLEYPIVYCPFLWQMSVRLDDVCLAFHDARDGHTLKIHLDSKSDPEAVNAAKRENRAELQRLLYVALTRAKHRCSIVWGWINDSDDSPLAYTLHPQRASMKETGENGLRRDLELLVRASNGAIVVRDLELGEPAPYTNQSRPSGELSARTFERKVDTWWRIGSFSALTSGSNHVRETISETEAHGIDHDEVDEIEAISPSLAAPFPETVKVPGLSAARTTERVIVDAFPRGARAGTMLHTILEEHDFANRDPDALAALVRKKLAAFGYTNNGRGEDLEEMLVRGLDAMLDTPLPRPPGVQVPGSGTLDGGNELSLRSITRDRRIDELEFILPIAQDERRQITAKAIAEVFAEHASDAVPREYAEHIARLGFLPLRGFLRGFVDLVFEHEGLFYVVDYKSNHLGPTAADYTPPRLASAMTHASYFLQYYLYVTAVDRWLRIRMRGYDYERCFGGVFYLFARGMSPTHTRGTGVFVDRPSRAMVETLSEVLDHG